MREASADISHKSLKKPVYPFRNVKFTLIQDDSEYFGSCGFQLIKSVVNNFRAGTLGFNNQNDAVSNFTDSRSINKWDNRRTVHQNIAIFLLQYGENISEAFKIRFVRNQTVCHTSPAGRHH